MHSNSPNAYPAIGRAFLALLDGALAGLAAPRKRRGASATTERATPEEIAYAKRRMRDRNDPAARALAAYRAEKLRMPPV